MNTNTNTDRYIPREFSLARSKPVTAGNEITSVDTCPQCNQTMRIMSVNGHNARVCVVDRIVFPIL